MAFGGLRSGLGLASLVLIGGAVVMMFFVVLAGVTNTSPLSKTYFLRADTSGVKGARAISQWTFFYVCGDGNTDCGKPVPALPFGYAWIGGGSGAPTSLLGSHGKDTTSVYYYYMWRFGWVFYLMGLIFTVFAFFTSLLAPCSRLASGVSGAITAFAWFWFTLAASLMTATFVQARNAFRSNGQSSSIGTYALGFTWGAWAALFISMILLFCGCGAGSRSSRRDDKVRTTRTPTTRTGGSLGFFRRQRGRSGARGSFVDTESQRRVKDVYA